MSDIIKKTNALGQSQSAVRTCNRYYVAIGIFALEGDLHRSEFILITKPLR